MLVLAKMLLIYKICKYMKIDFNKSLGEDYHHSI